MPLVLPLTKKQSTKQVKHIQKRMGVEEPKFKIDFQTGEAVNITDGPFKGFDGMVNEIDCRDPNTLYVAELMNWRVQKLTLKNEPATAATREPR